MKVLQLCPKPPLPSIDGGCLASFELSKILLKSVDELDVIALATEKHPYLIEEVNGEYAKATKFKAIEISTSITFSKIAKNLFERKSLHERRFDHRKVSSFLQKHLESHTYDLIVFDGLMSCVYLKIIRYFSNAKLIYRSHNIEFNILKQISDNRNSIIKKFYLSLQSNRLKRFEESIWNDCDKIWSISSSDKQSIDNYLGQNEKVLNIPFSMDSKATEVNVEENSIFHLGAMDWQPNIDGMTWFLEKVWPEVLNENPDATIHLGGRLIEKISDLLSKKQVVLHSDIIDADEFYSNYEIMIVPVLTASGVRIKLIQALEKGKVIVSTEQGAKGIPGVSGQHFIVCKDAADMSKMLNVLLRNPEKKETLKKNAKQLFLDNFSTEVVSQKIQNALSLD